MVEPGLARCRNGYAEDFDAFSFCLVSKSSRKTAQCCLEKNCVRAIERRTTVNSLPEGSPANHEKLYESEKQTELIQTTCRMRLSLGQNCATLIYPAATKLFP